MCSAADTPKQALPLDHIASATLSSRSAFAQLAQLYSNIYPRAGRPGIDDLGDSDSEDKGGDSNSDGGSEDLGSEQEQGQEINGLSNGLRPLSGSEKEGEEEEGESSEEQESDEGSDEEEEHLEARRVSGACLQYTVQYIDYWLGLFIL